MNPSTLQANPKAQRLESLDAYRGFVMFLMMAEVLRTGAVADALGNSAFWRFLDDQQSHVQWIGCSLHDMIQPSFSFIVGVALPFSMAARTGQGESEWQKTLHAFWRSLLLILLGVFLRSLGSGQTNWTFEDTLSQIGMGYGFLFLLGKRSFRAQWIAFVVLVLGYWAAFALFPLPGADFDWSKVNVTPEWESWLPGFAGHWNKNTNLAWAFDTWFLNLFPRTSPFLFNGGGYATLSFLPTLATMILGLQAGQILRSAWSHEKRLLCLLGAGIACIAAGAAVHVAGLCPIVKRIWTPSWVLFSGGMSFLFLAFFYDVIDYMGWKRWKFPLAVIGMNSIAAYCIAHLFDTFIYKNLTTHLGAKFFTLFGEPYAPFVHGAMVLSAYYLILLWMYNRKLFLRI